MVENQFSNPRAATPAQCFPAPANGPRMNPQKSIQCWEADTQIASCPALSRPERSDSRSAAHMPVWEEGELAATDPATATVQPVPHQSPRARTLEGLGGPEL